MSTIAPSPATTHRPRVSTRLLLREQTFVAAGQIGAGVGNLAFALLAARILAPGAFAELAVFLALFLVVHVPLSALSAGSAAVPGFAARHRHRALVLGLGAGAVIGALSLPLASLLALPAELVLVLALGAPSAGWLALERGRLIGDRAHGRAIASLAAEPGIRLAVGLPLAATTGAVGGAVGVVAGGWIALLLTRPGLPSPLRGTARRAAPTTAGLATAAFLLLAILQNADLVLANAALAELDAGRFAILSTLGGAAALATTTVPLVLLPRTGDDRRALGAALALAGGLGALAVAVAAALPPSAVGAAFGREYEPVAGLLVPYVAGMALLGVGRVLVAERVASGRGRALVPALLLLAATHATTIVALGDDPRTIALITIGAAATLVAVAALAGLLPATAAPPGPATRPRLPTPPREHVPAPTAAATAAAVPTAPASAESSAARVPWAALGALTAIALAVRLLVTRGIWLDEATSALQAQMSLGGLLENLRTTDVHPPLHHLVLWLLAQVAGTGEIVMRAPSIIAGTLLVPALYALGHLLWDRRAGLVAAILATVAPFLIWYAQEARMYAFFMLFAVVALIGQVWAIDGGGVRAWALYAAATVLLLWTQYFSIVLVAVQQGAFLAVVASRFRRDRPAARRFAGAWLGASALIVLAVLPVADLALDQFRANEAAGRGFDQGPARAGDIASVGERPDIYVVLTNLVWGALGYHSDATLGRLTALWPLAILATLFLLGRRPTWRAHLVAACALVPLLVLFVAGMAKPFLFEIRYFVATAPLLILLLARVTTAWTRSGAALAASVTAVVAVLAIATADQLFNGTNPRRYDFEGALASVEERMRPGDVLVYEPAYLDDIVRYYEPELRSAPLADGLPERRWAPRVFFISSFSDLPVHRRNAEEARRALSAERDVIGRFSRPQVEVTVYR